MIHPALPPRMRAQRGFTLIELMIGLTLGLIVVTALLMVFASASTQGQNFNRASTQIENGRYVSELLQDDVRMAGFVGELSTRGVGYSNPDPCATNPVDAFVYDAAAANPVTVPAPVQGIGPAEALACLTARSRRAGTQALVVRKLDPDTVTAAAVAGGNAQYYVQYSFCNSDPNLKLVYATKAADFTLHERTCKDPAPLRAYTSRIYFIADCNVCGSGGDDTPTLKRLELQGDSLVETALADGVENLRLEYGFDTNGDGDVDEYHTDLGGGMTATWGNVMTVRVHFITRSLDKASGSGLATAQTFNFGQLPTISTPSDGYTRRGYSTVVRLMNPAGAREVQ